MKTPWTLLLASFAMTLISAPCWRLLRWPTTAKGFGDH